jgi:hypothetical protein
VALQPSLIYAAGATPVFQLHTNWKTGLVTRVSNPTERVL